MSEAAGDGGRAYGDTPLLDYEALCARVGVALERGATHLTFEQRAHLDGRLVLLIPPGETRRMEARRVQSELFRELWEYDPAGLEAMLRQIIVRMTEPARARATSDTPSSEET